MAELHIGFTGTRKGMSNEQRTWLPFHVGQIIVGDWDDLWFHHGDCKGADSEAHDIMKSLGFKICIHPPSNSKYRAFRSGDVTEDVHQYLIRNRHIVDRSSYMFACPAQHLEIARGSGTWSTIRYARKCLTTLIVISV